MEAGFLNIGDNDFLFNTITFSNSNLSAPNNTITLNDGVLRIPSDYNYLSLNVTIDATSISGGVTVDANQQSSVFYVRFASAATFNNMTMTHALLEGSRARNQASRLNCPELDQRGEVREFRDGFCDVGAYEFFEEFVPSEETFYVIPLGDGKSVTIPL